MFAIETLQSLDPIRGNSLFPGPFVPTLPPPGGEGQPLAAKKAADSTSQGWRPPPPQRECWLTGIDWEREGILGLEGGWEETGAKGWGLKNI